MGKRSSCFLISSVFLEPWHGVGGRLVSPKLIENWPICHGYAVVVGNGIALVVNLVELHSDQLQQEVSINE